MERISLYFIDNFFSLLFLFFFTPVLDMCKYEYSFKNKIVSKKLLLMSSWLGSNSIELIVLEKMKKSQNEWMNERINKIKSPSKRLDYFRCMDKNKKGKKWFFFCWAPKYTQWMKQIEYRNWCWRMQSIHTHTKNPKKPLYLNSNLRNKSNHLEPDDKTSGREFNWIELNLLFNSNAN